LVSWLAPGTSCHGNRESIPLAAENEAFAYSIPAINGITLYRARNNPVEGTVGKIVNLAAIISAGKTDGQPGLQTTDEGGSGI
jgi:hypothetical protein